MKIAFSTVGMDSSSMMDPRFGRCQYFCIYDTETGESKTLENKGQLSGGGAGIAAAQQIIDEGIGAVATGNMGPNAYSLLIASGIKVYRAGIMTMNEAINALNSGMLDEITESGPAHYGMGGGFRGGV